MFAALIDKLHRREDLSEAESSEAMGRVMAGEATAAQIAGLLVALRMKGERPAEMVGLARAMREHAVRVPHGFDDVFDTCGTGGDGAGTLNVSSLAAIVAAACGVKVAKHGNRSVSSRCGSADLFEALGVDIEAEPGTVARCLAEAGIGFCFAPAFHPAMRHAAQARRELGVRTAFNLLGPLTNPAGASRQLVGVPRPEMTELVAHSLALLGSRRAWVVHGADGLDELSTTGHTKVSECRGGRVRTFYVHPRDAGLPRASVETLRGGDASENAALARKVLEGAAGPARDVVLLNAAAALLVAGRADSLAEGAARAGEAIDAGRAAATLASLAAISRGAALVRGETVSPGEAGRS